MHLLCLILLLTGTAHAQRFPIQAGTGIRGFSGDGGPAAAAQLAVPSAVFVDIDGNITIADTSNDRVRVIAPDGTIRTIAGIGERLSSGDGGPASAAALSSPTALFVDGGGNIYVAEWTGHRVRTITPTGVITTVVGVGEHGFLGDGGLASESNIWSPTALYIDGAKNTYIAEWGNHRIREISPDGLVSSLAGTGLPGFTGDGGPANGSRINSPNGLFVDDTGAVFFSDLGNQRIRRIDPSGIIRTVAGTGDGGPATEAGISNPSGLFIDGPGNLFFVDAGNDRIRRVNKDGIIETVAGGSTSANGPPLLPTDLRLEGPTSIFIDESGDLYLAEGSGHRVRRIPGIAEPTVLPGSQPKTSDFDGDAVVGFSDFLLFLEHFGRSADNAGFDDRFDLLEDGSITFPDFLRFARAFGSRTK